MLMWCRTNGTLPTTSERLRLARGRSHRAFLRIGLLTSTDGTCDQSSAEVAGIHDYEVASATTTYSVTAAKKGPAARWSSHLCDARAGR